MEYKVIPAILRETENEFVKDFSAAQTFAERVQIDIVDGKYAPHTTVNLEIIARHATNLPIELDLMVQDPASLLPQIYAIPSVQLVILHMESQANFQQLINDIHGHGKQAGLAINPETPPASVRGIQRVDQLMCMTIHPGAQGQPFLPESLDNVRRLREEYPNLPIEVDGGITDQTIDKAKAAGANFFCSGSFIFWHTDPKAQYLQLMALIS